MLPLLLEGYYVGEDLYREEDGESGGRYSDWVREKEGPIARRTKSLAQRTDASDIDFDTMNRS